MYITYQSTNVYSGDANEVWESLEEFICEQTFHQKSYKSFARLEEQPKLVCKLVARLIECLMEKNLLNLEDLKTITETCYGSQYETLKVCDETK